MEPCRRDTFPAIALSASYLKDVQGVGEDEAVVVCPVDPYVDQDYFMALADLGEQAGKSHANLVLMGIEPTYPSEKYGYIILESTDEISKVSMFKEKPTQDVARSYINQGALWNGGVFAFRLGYVLKRAHELIDFTDYQDLFACLGVMQYYFKPVRELPTGLGFADFVFIPKPEYKNTYPALVVELKWNRDAETALQQIKNKRYPELVLNYTGDILLVGINYDKNSKKHQCIIEKYEKA